MKQSRPYSHLFGISACITLFACGGRTQSTESTWLPNDAPVNVTSGSASSNGTVDGTTGPTIVQPGRVPPNSAPPTRPSRGEDTLIPPPPPPPDPHCPQEHEVVYPVPYTFGTHANAIQITSYPVNTQWCFTINPEQALALGPLSMSGFGLRFGDEMADGYQRPFPLRRRNAPVVRLDVRTESYHLLVAATEAVTPDSEGRSLLWGGDRTPNTAQGTHEISVWDFGNPNRGGGGTLVPDRFFALEFYILNTEAYDEPICVSNVAFLNSCGDVRVQTAIEWANTAPTATPTTVTEPPTDGVNPDTLTHTTSDQVDGGDTGNSDTGNSDSLSPNDTGSAPHSYDAGAVTSPDQDERL